MNPGSLRKHTMKKLCALRVPTKCLSMFSPTNAVLDKANEKKTYQFFHGLYSPN